VEGQRVRSIENRGRRLNREGNSEVESTEIGENFKKGKTSEKSINKNARNAPEELAPVEKK